MMYCSYHAKNPAVVQCNQCARWLCPACDHRVRGFPFCQDCIVAGVELLRHHSHAHPSNILRRKSSPFVATLLSFVPGLGAAYNGQTSKAIVHFAIFASFFTSSGVSHSLSIPFNAFAKKFRRFDRTSLTECANVSTPRWLKNIS